LHDVADELRPVRLKPGERVLEIVVGEHHAQVSERVDWR
jgi:hypothetical protein